MNESKPPYPPSDPIQFNPKGSSFGGTAQWMPPIVMASSMFLRDWFAGQALNYIGSTIGAKSVEATAVSRQMRAQDVIAGMAYELADAMLKAREAHS